MCGSADNNVTVCVYMYSVMYIIMYEQLLLYYVTLAIQSHFFLLGVHYPLFSEEIMQKFNLILEGISSGAKFEWSKQLKGRKVHVTKGAPLSNSY